MKGWRRPKISVLVPGQAVHGAAVELIPAAVHDAAMQLVSVA